MAHIVRCDACMADIQKGSVVSITAARLDDPEPEAHLAEPSGDYDFCSWDCVASWARDAADKIPATVRRA